MKSSGKFGHLIVVIVLLFAFLFVGGLYFFSRRNDLSQPEYRSSVPAIPTQQFVLVSCNLHWSAPSAQWIGELKNLKPDFILLQQVTHKDAQQIGESLDMRHGNQLQLYYSPTNPGTREVPGNAIISRHAIFQGRTIADQGPTDSGIWVEPVMGLKRFYLANVDLTPPPLAPPAAKLRQEAIDSLVASFANAPTPCIIGGVIPAAIRMPGGLSHDIQIHEEPIARFFLSPGWPAPTLREGSAGGVDYAILTFTPAAP